MSKLISSCESAGAIWRRPKNYPGKATDVARSSFAASQGFGTVSVGGECALQLFRRAMNWRSGGENQPGQILRQQFGSIAIVAEALRAVAASAENCSDDSDCVAGSYANAAKEMRS